MAQKCSCSHVCLTSKRSQFHLGRRHKLFGGCLGKGVKKKKKKKAAKSKVQSYPLQRPIVNNGAAKSSLYVYIITDEHGFIPKAAIVNVKTAAGDLAHFTNCL